MVAFEPRLLAGVRERVAGACRSAGRDPAEVRVVAVTKEVPPAEVARAAAAGLRDFGENYVQELEAKREAAADATWHFVGRLQRNKVRRVIDAVDLIHSVEPGSAAERLADLAGERPVPCLVQVDFVGTRVGVAPDELDRFLDGAAAGLRVRGLMTVPPPDEDPRPHFDRLRELRDRLRRSHPRVVELSMGMSADYEDAVREGATMVRIGTAIFGSRPGTVRRPPGNP